MYRIRQHGWTEVYLQPDGGWGEYGTAKKFTTQDAAERFAGKHNVTDYGIF